MGSGEGVVVSFTKTQLVLWRGDKKYKNAFGLSAEQCALSAAVQTGKSRRRYSSAVNMSSTVVAVQRYMIAVQ